jgi:excisionase family DNA binding protein
MSMITHDYDPLMKPGEVGELFGVEAKTVTMWARAGRLQSQRTPGGHVRFRWSVINALLADQR